ncbi:MAG: outer membrane lipoprotein-sorting protein [Alphaproteobacteria bacterium]|nr:outer membrane lipoprotein-sorting protein [Alphaproteobacteria bacterium]
MILRFALVSLFISTCFLPIAHAETLTARQIMERVDDRDDGDRRTAEMRMVLTDKNGDTRERRIATFDKDARGEGGAEDRRRIMFFLDPADVKDTGFLTYDYDAYETDDDQWLYLPALKKTKRIASSDKSGSFMGSDFNYSDMTRRNLDAYDFEILKDDAVRGAACWVIQSTPKTQDEIDETGYQKSVVFVRQDNFVVVRAVHWTDTGGKLKYLDVTGLEQIDGIWTITEMSMTTKKNKVVEHKTDLTFSNVRYNQDLDDQLFTLRRLEKGM